MDIYLNDDGYSLNVIDMYLNDDGYSLRRCPCHHGQYFVDLYALEDTSNGTKSCDVLTK